MELIAYRYTGTTQTFAFTIRKCDLNAIESLIVSCEFGPGYDRGVRDNLERYADAVRKGDDSSAAYWLGKAIACADYTASRMAARS